MPTLRRSFVLRLSAVAAFAAVLGACSTATPPPRQFPELRFTHMAPITLTAQGPEVVAQYQPPLREPNVEHILPLPPERAIRTWVQDRLRTTGVGDDRVRVIIRDASVVEVPLEVKEGVVDFFTDDQEVRYDARMEIVAELLDTGGRQKAETVVTGFRSRTFNEDASLREREKMWYELVEKLMQDVDVSLEKNIRTYFRDALMAQ
jgi:hypothetical protein